MRRLVLGFGGGVILLLAAVAAWWLQRAYQEAAEAGVAMAQALARGHAAYVTRLLAPVDELSGAIAAAGGAGLPPAEFAARLRQQQVRAPFLADFMLFDARGALRLGSGVPPQPQELAALARQGEQAGSAWFAGEAPAPAGRSLITLGRALAPGGAQGGRLIVCRLDAGRVETLLAALAVHAHSRARLVRLEAASPTRPAGGEWASDTELGWLEPVGGYPLGVTVGLERGPVFAPWRRGVLAGGAGLLLVGGSMAALTLLLARKIDENAQTEGRFRALVEQSLVGIYYVREGVLEYANPHFAQLFGLAPGALEAGVRLIDLVAVSDRERVRAHLAGWASGRSNAALVFSGLRGDGVHVELEAQARPVDAGRGEALFGVLHDVTERQRSARQLHFLAFHDSLTGLPNRVLFFDRLNQAIYRAKRDTGRFAVLMIDLDGFKAVNDRFGHEAGDALLVNSARRLQGCVRESDTVARIGGDEFVVILHAVEGLASVRLVADKALAALAEPTPLAGGEARVGASIGIAFYPEDGAGMEELLSHADAAMYASKAGGRNMASFYAGQAMPGRRHRMDLIEWGEEHLTGISMIDTQHQHLAALVNALARGVMDADAPQRIRELLAELVGYARLHFETEEAYMDAHRVPGADLHKLEHRRLTDDLLDALHQYEQHGATAGLHGIRDWLLQHIGGADRELGRTLKAGGVA